MSVGVMQPWQTAAVLASQTGTDTPTRDKVAENLRVTAQATATQQAVQRLITTFDAARGVAFFVRARGSSVVHGDQPAAHRGSA